MANVKELTEALGRTGMLRMDGGLGVAVRVLDVRVVYARTEYLVTPWEGEGQTWVASHRVRLLDKEASRGA